MAEKKESKIRSADDLIIKAEAEKLGKPIPELPKLEEKEEGKIEQEIETKEPEAREEKSDDEEGHAEEKEVSEKIEREEVENSASDTLEDEEVDEYGTKVGKKKLYTEEEVNRMMRERLKRGRHSDDAEKDVQNAAKDFKPDPESNEAWEVQLEQFVEKTIQKISKKASDEEWQQHERQSQADFEIKFSEGMGKYKDFQNVVGNKPITNAMMLATRTMKDPAAFLYAACKQHPKELSKIAEIRDPVAQATEIGRLEERMKKARNLPSSPKPAKLISGDSSSELPQLGIDERIAAHAKSKIMR